MVSEHKKIFRGEKSVNSQEQSFKFSFRPKNGKARKS